MAELLIRVVDKVNTDSVYLDVQCTKRGDVIAAQPDGWIWGMEELTHPRWRVLKIPALSMDQATALLAPEKNTDPSQPSRTLQKRAFKLNVDGLPSDVLAAVADAVRSNPILLLADPAATAQQLAANDPTLTLVNGQPMVRVCTGRNADGSLVIKRIPLPVFRVTLATLQALVVQKPPVQDPALLGQSTGVLGGA